LFGDTGERARFDHSLAFTPDGMWLAVAGRSGIEIWDPRARQLNQRLDTSGRVPQHVAVSPDGNWLAAANSEDCWLEVWRRTGSEFRSVWRLSSIAANELTFSAARGTLAVSDWVADRVAVFRVESGQLDREISARQCYSVAYSPDGRSLAFTELDKWRVAGELSRSAVEFNAHWNTVRGVCWSPSGRLLATCGEDRRVVVWDPLLARRRCDLIGHRSQSIRGHFVDEERLLTLEENGELLVWHVGLGRLLCRLRPLLVGRCFDMAVAPDRQTVACHLEDGRVQILRLNKQSE
ncbi:MAG: WD40 repeat domain-containing protein, partial [Planctomycetota bacterium]